jgi:hypothetical protein
MADSAAAPAETAGPGVAQETEDADEVAAALALVEDQPPEEAPAKVEPPKDEAPKQEAKPEEDEAPKGPAAKGWAAVRKREQRLAEQQKAFKSTQAQIQQQTQQITQRLQQIEEREAQLEKDPVAFLEKRGMTFDDLARRHLANGKASPQEEARRGAEAQKTEAQELRTQLAEVKDMLQRQEQTRVLNDYRADIGRTLATEDFELLRAYPDAASEVEAFAEKYAQTHGVVLSPQDAASKLQVEWRKQLSALSTHEVVKRHLLGSGNGAHQQASGRSQVPQGSSGNAQSGPRTLTNNLAATPAADVPNRDDLSEEEELQAALRLVSG